MRHSCFFAESESLRGRSSLRLKPTYILLRFLLCGLLVAIPALAQERNHEPNSNRGLDSSVPPMRALIERYTDDQATLSTVYTDSNAPATRERWADFYKQNRAALTGIDFPALDREGQVDYVLFANLLTQQDHQLALENKQWAEVSPLVPFAPTVFALEDAKRQMERPDPEKSAAAMNELAKAVAASHKELEAKVKEATPAERITRGARRRRPISSPSS